MYNPNFCVGIYSVDYKVCFFGNLILYALIALLCPDKVFFLSFNTILKDLNPKYLFISEICFK